MSTVTSTGFPAQRPDSQLQILSEGWLAYSLRNPGGAEPADPTNASANNWIRWGGGPGERLLVLGSGRVVTGNAVYKEVKFPADGTTVPVSDGTVRTAAPAGTVFSLDYGGLPLAIWDSLWVRLDWYDTATVTPATSLFIVRGNLANDTSRLLPSAPGVEWVRLCTMSGNGVLSLWDGDTIRRGTELGSGGSGASTITAYAPLADGLAYSGYQFVTAAPAFGFTPSIQLTAENNNNSAYGEPSTLDINTPAIGTPIRFIGGATTGTDTSWRASNAADQWYLFGSAQVDTSSPINPATVPVVDFNGTAGYTLCYHRRLGSSTSVTSPVTTVTSWYLLGDGTSSLYQRPPGFLPIVKLGPYASGEPAGVAIIANTSIPLYPSDILVNGTDALAQAAQELQEQYVFLQPPTCRFSSTTFLQPGAVTNGSIATTVATNCLMFGWEDNTLVPATGGPSTATGIFLGYLNMPPAGTAIPVMGMVGATRVVQTLAGTTIRYIPLATNEVLRYRHGARQSTASAGWMVEARGIVGFATKRAHGSIRIAAVSSILDDVDVNRARIDCIGGISISPGLNTPPATQTFGDGAEGHNRTFNATLPGARPPGGSAALPAVANVVGIAEQPQYYVSTDPATRTARCYVRGALTLSGNITSGAGVLFLPGVYAKGATEYHPAVVLGLSGVTKPRAVMVQPVFLTLGGAKGTVVYLHGANNVSNPNLSGGDISWGTPTRVDIRFDFECR